ncbi:hypothetical protein HK098_006214 [Nowakowskiella sp. JEL0407]|nr:hypothetical protein HK098_006214 [Nowakowskiella sp. JEL0407]
MKDNYKLRFELVSVIIVDLSSIVVLGILISLPGTITRSAFQFYSIVTLMWKQMVSVIIPLWLASKRYMNSRIEQAKARKISNADSIVKTVEIQMPQTVKEISEKDGVEKLSELLFYAVYRVYAYEVTHPALNAVLERSDYSLAEIHETTSTRSNSVSPFRNNASAIIKAVTDLVQKKEISTISSLGLIKDPHFFPSKSNFELSPERLSDTMAVFAYEMYKLFIMPNSEFELNLTNTRMKEVLSWNFRNAFCKIFANFEVREHFLNFLNCGKSIPANVFDGVKRDVTT